MRVDFVKSVADFFVGKYTRVHTKHPVSEVEMKKILE